MGIQINGQTDIVTSTTAGGKVTIPTATFPSVTDLNATGIVTASSFRGNITGNVNASGVSTFSSGVVIAAGTVSVPSISPSGDSNTGIFFPSPDTVAIAEGGVEALRVDSSANIGIGTAISLSKVHIQGTGNGSSGSTGLNDSSAASSLLLKPVIGSGTALSLGTRNTGGHYIQGLYAASSVESVRDIQINPYGGSVGIGTFADAFGGVPGSSTFVVATTGLERLRIDSSGRVTMPYQPACDVYGTGTCTVTDGATQNLTLSSFQYNRGFSITSNKLVIPKTGYYFFTTGYISSIISSTYNIRAIRIFPRINGTVLSYPDARWNSAPLTFSNSHYEIKHTWIVNLVENDQIDLQVAIYHNKGSALNDSYYTHIQIFLLG